MKHDVRKAVNILAGSQKWHVHMQVISWEPGICFGRTKNRKTYILTHLNKIEATKSRRGLIERLRYVEDL